MTSAKDKRRRALVNVRIDASSFRSSVTTAAMELVAFVHMQYSCTDWIAVVVYMNPMEAVTESVYIDLDQCTE